MTPFIRFFLLLCLLSGIPSTRAVSGSPKPVNFIILLDLSDRLLNPDQANRDLAMVQAVFRQFETSVREQFIINAKDRFRVVIAPQRGVAYTPERYESMLYLNLASEPIGEKRKRLDALRQSIPGVMRALYTQALQGRHRSRDFAGCDLWQYVNDQLPTDLEPDCRNVLVILTDGYLDFEDNPRALRSGNRSTDSRMLDRLRRDSDWRRTLQRPDEGLLPVRKPLPRLSVYVAEVHPKYDNLNEVDLLRALWDKWLREMNVHRRTIQVQGSQPKALSMLQAFLSVRE